MRSELPCSSRGSPGHARQPLNVMRDRDKLPVRCAGSWRIVPRASERDERGIRRRVPPHAAELNRFNQRAPTHPVLPTRKNSSRSRARASNLRAQHPRVRPRLPSSPRPRITARLPAPLAFARFVLHRASRGARQPRNVIRHRQTEPIVGGGDPDLACRYAATWGAASLEPHMITSCASPTPGAVEILR